MDLALRNNRTSEEFPEGIFHPHRDVQHIKKENIGLIEVMGLAVLPGRLKTELDDIKKFILSDDTNSEELLSKVADYHKTWAMKLKSKYSLNVQIDRFIEVEIGNKFARLLEDAGVFKQTSHGIEGFKKFADTLGAKYM